MNRARERERMIESTADSVHSIRADGRCPLSRDVELPYAECHELDNVLATVYECVRSFPRLLLFLYILFSIGVLN